MEQLRMKLKTLKTMMTENKSKLETAITTFQKVKIERGSAVKIKRKAEDIIELLDRLESETKEMDTLSFILKGVMCESERDKLGDSQVT